MKKILFVIHNMEIGGIQKALVNLLTEISGKYDISLIIFAEEGALMKALPNNIKIVSVKSSLQVLGISQRKSYDKSIRIMVLRTIGAIWSRLFGNRWMINWLIRNNKVLDDYDYAISYAQFQPQKYFSGGTNEFVLNCVDAKKKIAFVHSDFQKCGGNSKYARREYKLFDKIAFCSKSAQKSFLEIMPNLADKTSVVKNFNDYKKIRNLAFSNTIKYPRNSFNVVSISRLSCEKGIDRAIKAVAYCLEKNIKINYYIIGDGPDKNRLINIADKYKVQKNVFFCGANENPYRFLPNADLLLFPSVHEAAGLVIEEAASLGIPVLATKTISSEEMVLENDFGWVSEENQESFSKYLEFLLQNPWKILEKKELIRSKVFNNKSNIEQFNLLISD